MQPPDDRDLDEEIRGHLALSVKEHIENGADPERARLAALRELGYVPAVRESMRKVWYSEWFDAGAAFAQDIRIALRSLPRAKGLAVAVVSTLALGIGANVAMFSVVREVLLRPLVNRDEERLIYIRQSAPGLGAENTTFSVPELEDLRAHVSAFSAFGDFSTVGFTLIGFGEPRLVKAGVVGGSYFDVMGLRPVLGRLLNAADDVRDAPPVAVLTHRFWSETLAADPTVVGRTIRLDTRTATVVGVLEPSVPYPADTEIIANVVTSPHHLSATMVTMRTHRMTELFARLKPGVTLEEARVELAAAHEAMMREHQEAYPPSAHMQVQAARLRDQLAAPARTILLLLLAAAGVVFVIACSNVANLILARAVRRESELAVRAALGATPAALRRTLLAESLVLCGAGAVIGVLLARPLVAVVGRYASRFSVRALDVTVDASLLWLGAALAIGAAVVLAYVPRLPSKPSPPTRLALSSSGVRMTPGTSRRLHVFAIVQIALSFVLLAGAGMLLSALTAVQNISTGFELRQVLAIDVPLPLETPVPEAIGFTEQMTQKVAELPGVHHVAIGSFVPWRDVTALLPTFAISGDGYAAGDGEELPRARIRNVAPGFFDTLGIPIIAGRDFTDDDRRGREPVVMISESVARRLFATGEAVGQHMWWVEPLFGKPEAKRIVGVVADADDEHLVPGQAMTVYHPFRQVPHAGRLFVRAAGDPYALVPLVTQVIQGISSEQPVERAATLADVRAEALGRDRLNAFVFSGFAGVALLIAVVGVAGVLAFSVSARLHEFGVRLAVGSTPWRLLAGVVREGAVIVGSGIAAGVGCAYVLRLVATNSIVESQVPALLSVLGAAAVLATAAVIATLLPAARASRVDVLQALRAE